MHTLLRGEFIVKNQKYVGHGGKKLWKKEK
jgi:hypothetical protein